MKSKITPHYYYMLPFRRLCYNIEKQINIFWENINTSIDYTNEVKENLFRLGERNETVDLFA